MVSEKAQSGARVGKEIAEVIEALDLRRTVIDTGLAYEVGVGGTRLSPAQRQRLALARCLLKRPDVVIVNTVPADSAWSELSDAVHTTWRDRQAPVILIGDTAGIEQKVESFRSKVADYLPANFHDTQLFARLQALLRINTMHEELLRRIFTVEKYGVKDIEAAIHARRQTEPNE